MSDTKPYLAYEFTGLKPLTESLYKHGIEFEIIPDECGCKVFEIESEILNENDDVIRIGTCSRDGKVLFFAEFGLKITEHARSFITFIYDHHPTLDEIVESARDIEQLTINRLKVVQGDVPPVS